MSQWVTLSNWPPAFCPLVLLFLFSPHQLKRSIIARAPQKDATDYHESCSYHRVICGVQPSCLSAIHRKTIPMHKHQNGYLYKFCRLDPAQTPQSFPNGASHHFRWLLTPLGLPDKALMLHPQSWSICICCQVAMPMGQCPICTLDCYTCVRSHTCVTALPAKNSWRLLM